MTFFYYLLLLAACAVMGTSLAIALRLRKTAPEGALRRAATLLLGLIFFFLVGYLLTPLATPEGHEADYVLVTAIYLAGAAFVLIVLRLIGALTRQVESELVALRESEEKFRALADQSPNLIYTFDLESDRLLYVNDSWEKEFGLSRERLLGESGGLLGHVDADCRELVRNAHDRQRRGKQTPAFECTFIDAGGRRRETLVATRHILLDGRSAAIGVVADITDHKSREAALRHRLEIESILEVISESFVTAAPEEIGDAVTKALDTIGVFAGSNRGCVVALGEHGAAEIVNEWCSPGVEPRRGREDFAPPTGLPWFTERIRRFETVQITDVEALPDAAAAERNHWRERKVGALLAVPLVARRVLTGFMCFESARPRRFWPEEDMGLFVVAGDLLAGALERQRYIAGLRESEERFRMLFDAATDAIFILGDEGRILDVNRTGHERLGYTKEEMLSMRISDIDLPKFAAQVPERMDRALREGRAVFETGHRRKDGTAMPVEVNARVIEYLRQPAFLSVARDITGRKLADDALHKAKDDLERQNEELRALDRMKDGLIRDVSHELKTPVAKHAMQLEILKRIVGHHSLEAAEERAFRVMEESIRRQQSVIRNLLDLSRLEAGGRSYRHENVRLDEVFARVVDDYRYAIDAHEVAIEVAVPPVEILSDDEMLWHVFSNLINNAIKFRDEETAAQIVISAKAAKHEVVVRIADNGIGLAPGELEKMFTRFYQASASREGTGLGLTICRKIVEGLGGRIVIESPGRGEGATAVVTLPLG